MPEWLVERGIGETRCALIDHGEILEARIELEGMAAAGTVLAARLVNVGSEGRNAIARDEAGVEYLLPKGALSLSEGATVAIEVTRQAVPTNETWKRPLATITDQPPTPAPAFTGRELRFPAAVDELGIAGWNDLLEEARSGVVRFAGGELRLSPTPAMTLIDVDGSLPLDKLASIGATEAARAIRRLDIGGSIGIDLPTSGNKMARQSAALAIDKILPKPFERTAVNGFGFVQIVRPRVRASLVELVQDRASFEARALLRRTAFEPAGRKRLVAHPSVITVLEGHRDWLAKVARQVGGEVQLRRDAALPMSGGYAEKF